jgi:GntR family transcriptional regulator/MocR family aminotransferase
MVFLLKRFNLWSKINHKNYLIEVPVLFILIVQSTIMLPFKTLITINATMPLAIFRQVASQLTKLIQQGTLTPEMPLPSSRVMVDLLGIHRKTIMAAYNEMLTQGWIESLPRRGYRVADNLPEIMPRSYSSQQMNSPYKENTSFLFKTTVKGIPQIQFPENPSAIIVNDGFPDLELAPLDKIQKEYRKLIGQKQLKRLMSDRDQGGTPALKHAVRLFLNESRGLNISTGNLMITRGAQMAIYLAAALLIKPGDKVLVSDPSYFIADKVFRQFGAELIRVPVDQDGINTDLVEDMLKKHKIALLYVIPHHHHPTTVTMSANRRVQLLQLIKRYRLPVIEDDYDYDFHYGNSPYLPLASAAHDGQVIYIGSFTKLIAPSFRLGYMVASPNFIPEAIQLKKMIDLRGDTMMEEAVAQLIQNGDLGRHIKRSNKIYSARCDYAAKLLEEQLGSVLDFTKPQGGMALWLRFKKEYPVDEVIKKSAVGGLHLLGAAYYHSAGQQHNGLRFGFASLSTKELETAVERLKKAIMHG